METSIETTLYTNILGLPVFPCNFFSQESGPDFLHTSQFVDTQWTPSNHAKKIKNVAVAQWLRVVEHISTIVLVNN